jgi:hypothetical protein
VTSFRRVTFRFRSFEEDLGIIREFLPQLVDESIYKIRYILSDVAKISVQRKDLDQDCERLLTSNSSGLAPKC